MNPKQIIDHVLSQEWEYVGTHRNPNQFEVSGSIGEDKFTIFFSIGEKTIYPFYIVTEYEITYLDLIEELKLRKNILDGRPTKEEADQYPI